jgi:phage gp46-like protein
VTDIRIIQIKSPFEITLDWLMTPMHTLDETQELATGIIVALGTDRLALEDDVLPDLDSTDRRGWWGDTEAELIWGGWPIGTRCWLLRRAKITGPESAHGSTVAWADFYVRECLQPFVDKHIASSIDVEAARVERERIDVRAVIYRGPLPAIELRYQGLWIDQARQAQPEIVQAHNPVGPSLSTFS